MSLIVIAVGAILTWAVDATVSGLNVDAVGVILMVVGLIGFVLSLVFWSTWWGLGYFRHTVVVDGPTYPHRRRTVEENAPTEEIVEQR